MLCHLLEFFLLITDYSVKCDTVSKELRRLRSILQHFNLSIKPNLNLLNGSSRGPERLFLKTILDFSDIHRCCHCLFIYLLFWAAFPSFLVDGYILLMRRARGDVAQLVISVNWLL